MKKYIEGIILEFSERENHVKLRYCEREAVFPNQKIENIFPVIVDNLQIVKKHYQKCLDNGIDLLDFNCLCIIIVVQYLYQYNLWRNTNPKIKGVSLKFNTKDFDDFLITDIVTSYFRDKYCKDCLKKSSIFLNLNFDEFMERYQRRKDFYLK